MKRVLVLIIFSFTICKLSAKEIKWYEGSVVLETREVLVGKISMEMNHDLILFQHGARVDIFPAHKIRSVRFYDAQANINRKFISIQESNHVWQAYHLYEIVLPGEVNVLRKEKISSTHQKSDADDFIYFVRHKNDMTELTSFRSKVFPMLMKTSGQLLTMFIVDNHLNPNKPANAIQIIQYYNQLMQGDQTLARY